LPLLLLLGSAAHAQEVEVGPGLICDTREQVERFVDLYDGDMEDAVGQVNEAEHDPTACIVSEIAYVRGAQLGTARKNSATFQIVPILVLGVVTASGILSVTPGSFFSAIKVDETPI
jgi:hypothetical protein